MHNYLKYTTLGIEILLYVGVPAVAGYFADEHFGFAKPWLLLAGALLGCVAAIYRLIKVTDKL